MFKNILVPVDFEKDEEIERALKFVSKMADETAVVRFLHVVYSTPSIVSQFLPQDFEQKASLESMNKLKEVARKSDLGKLTTDFVVRHGNVYREILEMADAENVDLIVLCSHTPAAEDYILGSNASRVVRHAKSTVVILR